MHDLRPNQRLALRISRVYAPKSKSAGHEAEYFSVQCQNKEKCVSKHEFSEKCLLIRGQQIFQNLGTNSKFWTQEE